MVFTELDHAAAARDVGMTLRARTVLMFVARRAANPTLVKHGGGARRDAAMRGQIRPGARPGRQ